MVNLNALRAQLGMLLCLGLFAVGINAGEPQPTSSIKETYDLMLAAEQTGEDGRTFKEYEHKSEKFKVFKPENDSISIEGLDGAGSVSIDRKRRVYLYSTPGVISYPANTVEQAFKKIADRLIKNAGRPPVAQLRKGLDEFYEDLPASKGK